MYDRRYTYYRRTKKRPRYGTFLTLLLVACFGWWLFSTVQAKPNKQNQTDTIKAELQAKPSIDTSAMDSRIQAILAENADFDTSIVIHDLNTGKIYTYGESSAYVAASINKLVTAAAFMHKVELGEASLSAYQAGSTAQAQLERALVDSDHTAWESFYIGTPCSQQNSYAQTIGLTTYDCKANELSAADTAVLLAKLYKGELLNKAHTDLLLSYLKRANYREYIVAAVPSGATVYHKAGYLQDRVHDAAIITDGEQTYVLAIFTKSYSGTYDSAAGTALIHQITKATTETFLR